MFNTYDRIEARDRNQRVLRDLGAWGSGAGLFKFGLTVILWQLQGREWV